MSRFSSQHQDGYEAALVTLTHTPVRFLAGAIAEIASRYGESRADVESDMFDLLDARTADETRAALEANP